MDFQLWNKLGKRKALSRDGLLLYKDFSNKFFDNMTKDDYRKRFANHPQNTNINSEALRNALEVSNCYYI